MADISKLNLKGTLYNIKDSTARTNVSNLESSLGTAAYKDYATVAIGTEGEAAGALPTVSQIETYVSNKVTGSMHYIGMFDSLPAASGYEAGDVVIVNVKDSEGTVLGRREYICTLVNGSKLWEELGDEEGLYATTMQLNAVKGTGWTNETVKGNADNVAILDTSVGVIEDTIGEQPVPADGTILNRLELLEDSAATGITSSDISNWNSKQAAITDGSAEIAVTDSEGNISLYNVAQSGGAISTGSKALDLAAVAVSGRAADLTTDTTHRLVTDEQITNWNSGNNYITQVSDDFEVASNGQLNVHSGKRLITDSEGNKLTGITAGATKTESSSTNGNIKINGSEVTVYTLPSDVVQDSNYAHITVTSSSVSDGVTTFNKYIHPQGTAATQTSGFYKFATDDKSHIANVTNVGESDVAGLLHFITAYDGTNNKIATASDIAGGVHFKGVYASKEDIDFTPVTGDMIIIGTKEYIYNTTSVSSESDGWQEIGDENAWDTKGSAAAAETAAKTYAKNYADGLVTDLDSSISETQDSEGNYYAVTGVTVTEGKITANTKKIIPAIPTNVSAFNNDANYATQQYVNDQIQLAIHDAIAASY